MVPEQHVRPEAGLGCVRRAAGPDGRLAGAGPAAAGRESVPLAWSFWGAAIGCWPGRASSPCGRWAKGRRASPLRRRARSITSRASASSASTSTGVGIWPPVYDFAPLLAGQLVFAYAFDMLLAWSRREDYALGFGPFPIVFSTNLFLWFKDDWFSLQFLLIAVGFLGKAFVRWDRDGRRVHIFNPSAFTLALFSLVLLATGTTSITWGQEIATTFGLGPRIYLVLFLVGLVVMYFFSITPVTAAAAATLFAGERALPGGDRRALLRRFGDSRGGVPRAAPAGDRSVHVATHAIRARDFRRALWPGGRRALRHPRRHGDADLLRQAAVRAAAEPGGAGNRSRRASDGRASDPGVARARRARSAGPTSRTSARGSCSSAR